jgi:hypothetical protein
MTVLPTLTHLFVPARKKKKWLSQNARRPINDLRFVLLFDYRSLMDHRFEITGDGGL